MRTKTIKIEPNFNAIHNRFRIDAMLHLETFTNEVRQVFAREEIYAFAISLDLAMSAITNIEEFIAFREEFGKKREDLYRVVQREKEGV